MEKITNIIDRVKKFGVASVSHCLHKLWVPAGKSKLALTAMVMMGAVVPLILGLGSLAALITKPTSGEALATVPAPPQSRSVNIVWPVPKTLLGLLCVMGLLKDSEALVPHEQRSLIASLDFGTFNYRQPPCTDSCGEIPAVCLETGYFSDSVHNFWKDPTDGGVCKTISSPVPKAPIEALTQCAFWGTLVGGALSALEDGRLGLDDAFKVFAGYTWSVRQQAQIKEAKMVTKMLQR